MKAKNKLFAVLIGLLVTVAIICRILSYLGRLNPPDEVPPQILYPYLSQEFEQEWLETLARGPINHVEAWNPYGLSKKFKVYFKDGKVASGKLMHPFSFWRQYFRLEGFRSADRDHRRNSRSAWGDYQAMSELAAFYVDRALGYFRKPPTSGRKISSKIMYANDDSWFGFMQRVLPEYSVEVTLIAWFDGISVRPPSNNALEVMLHNEKPSKKDLPTMADISDVLVFDFLVDDHDRIEAHNWLKDRLGYYIFWDSGLGFRHGPHGKVSRDREIFCGRRDWVTLTTERNADHQCEKICMFRKSTIDQLRGYGYNTTEVPGPKLSKLVFKEMKNDPLYPVFNYNVYLPGRMRFPKLSYRYQDFLDGIDIRTNELKIYVDECIEKFGEENVLLDI